MSVKVHIFSRHSDAEFGAARMALLKKIHGKDTIIEFDHETRFSGDMEQKKQDCVDYFKQKKEEKYICYVVLPKFLKMALLENGIAYGVIEFPVKVKNGKLIEVNYFEPEKTEPQRTASRIVRETRESNGYTNTTGKKKAVGRR